MDYTPTILNLELRKTLLMAATTAATLSALVEGQPTLNPTQREAVERFHAAADAVRNAMNPEQAIRA